MGIRGIKRLVCGMLALSMVVLAANSTFSAQKEGAANKDVIDVADGKAKATDIAAKINGGKMGMDDLMHAFKPRTKGGIGVGNAAGTVLPDAIELKINALAKKPLTPAVLTKEAADLTRMADLTRAIGEITENSEQKKNGAVWKKLSQDMIKGSKELSEAVAKNNPDKVKTAAGKIAASCNDCHAKFRDN